MCAAHSRAMEINRSHGARRLGVCSCISREMESQLLLCRVFVGFFCQKAEERKLNIFQMSVINMRKIVYF